MLHLFVVMYNLFTIYYFIFIIYLLFINYSKVGSRSWCSTTVCIDSDARPVGPPGSVYIQPTLDLDCFLSGLFR